MHPRVTLVKRGDKVYRYLRIVEGVREGGRARQRTVADLGGLTQANEEQWALVAPRLRPLLGKPSYLPSEIEGQRRQWPRQAVRSKLPNSTRDRPGADRLLKRGARG